MTITTIPSKFFVQEFVDMVKPIEDKNRGGCLFMCLLFWRWLKHNGMDTDSFQIVQYGDTEQIANNLEWIEGNEDCPGSSTHFTWLYDGIEYDSDGPFEKPKYGWGWCGGERVVLEGLNSGFEMVEEFCVKALLRQCCWNPSFEREPAYEYILDHFQIDMSDCLYL